MVELQERLIIEDHMIELVEPRFRLIQAVGYRMMWEGRVMFLAGEALLLGGRNDASVLNQGRCTVVW